MNIIIAHDEVQYSVMEKGWRVVNYTLSPPICTKNLVAVPGMDGSIDFSEVLTGEPTYGDRQLAVSLDMLDGEVSDRDAAITDFIALFAGQVCAFIVDNDKEHYIVGRVDITATANDLAVAQIDLSAVVSPWLVKLAPTVVSEGLTGEDVEISLPNERRRVVPTIKVTADTTITWQGNTIAMSAGSHRDLDIRLEPGDNMLLARTTAGGEGSITITYQEARL